MFLNVQFRDIKIIHIVTHRLKLYTHIMGGIKGS